MLHALNKRCFDKESLSVEGQSPLANRCWGAGGGGPRGYQVNMFEQVWDLELGRDDSKFEPALQGRL